MLAFTYPPVGAAFVGSLPAAVRGPAGRSPARHLWRPTPKCVPSRRASPGGTWIVNIPRVQLWGSLCSLFRKSPSCLVSSHWVGTNPTVHFCDSHAVFLERRSASLPHSSYRTSVHISHTHALYIYIYIYAFIIAAFGLFPHDPPWCPRSPCGPGQLDGEVLPIYSLYSKHHFGHSGAAPLFSGLHITSLPWDFLLLHHIHLLWFKQYIFCYSHVAFFSFPALFKSWLKATSGD